MIIAMFLTVCLSVYPFFSVCLCVCLSHFCVSVCLFVTFLCVCVCACKYVCVSVLSEDV